MLTEPCAKPDPGLEQLPLLLPLTPLDWIPSRYSDVPGLRTNAIWEAVYLFHKCSHTNLAAQRLALQGMHSWCLFNAYHSAYIGAKGIMAIFGVALPKLKDTQVAIDLFPAPETKQSKKSLATSGIRFDEFVILRLPMIDQRRIWEGLQRLLRVCGPECWDDALTSEITSIDYEKITPPRNHFLYKAQYWPLQDLVKDLPGSELKAMIAPELDTDKDGFLLRLSFVIYHLFERLMEDLAAYSPPIKVQLDASRCLVTTEIPELDLYRDFVAQT